MWPFRKKKPTFSENREAMRRFTEEVKREGLDIKIYYVADDLSDPEILFRPNPPSIEKTSGD